METACNIEAPKITGSPQWSADLLRTHIASRPHKTLHSVVRHQRYRSQSRHQGGLKRMVNIPGRSKGCLTCRRRKVKCDEGKPTCQRCHKGNHDCQGYPHPLRVVFDRSCAEVPPGKEGEASTSKAAERTNESNRLTVSRSVSRSLSRTPSNEEVGDVQRELASRPFLREPGLSPLKDDIYSSFLVKNLLVHLDIGQGAILSAFENRSPTTDDSVQALAMAFYGRLHRHDEICQQGAVWYGKALRKLSRDLTDPNHVWSTSIVLSTATLAMYEFVTSTQMTPWIQHAGGVGRLIEARGPWRHQSPEELRLFKAVRPMIAARATNHGTRCFLEELDWRTIPWNLDPSQKSSHDHLTDFACALPGLLEDRKYLKIARLADFATSASAAKLKAFKIASFAVPPSTTDRERAPRTRQEYQSLVTALEGRVSESARALQDWKNTWDESSPASSALGLVPSQPLSYDLPIDLFGPALQFPDLQHANTYTLYNMILFHLLGISIEIRYGWLSPTAFSSTTSSTPPTAYVSPSQSADIPADLALKRRETAIEICRAVPYHLWFEKHGSAGAYLLMWPLISALQLFIPPWTETSSPEAQWIKGVLRHIAERWGLGSMFLADEE